MAITPLIEKAILNGWGTLRNFSVGGGGLVKIKIPSGHFGIVTDFIYHPWHTVYSQEDAAVLPNSEADTFQEIAFYSNGKSNKWTFKNSWSISHIGGAIGTTYYPMESFKVDTMFIVDTDIYIQFKNPIMLALGGLVTDFSKLPTSQSVSFPETVGVAVPTTRQIQTALGDVYVFPGIEENLVDASGKMTTINSQNGTELYCASGAQPNYNYQLPLLNVQVLMVAEQNRNFLNQRD